MVGPQIVDLLAENGRPEVFADEFHQIQLVLEFGVLSRQLLNQSVASVVTWNKMFCKDGWFVGKNRLQLT